MPPAATNAAVKHEFTVRVEKSVAYDRATNEILHALSRSGRMSVSDARARAGMKLLNRGVRLADGADLFPRRVIPKKEAFDCRDGWLLIGTAHLAMLVESNLDPGPRGVWPAHGDRPSRRTFGFLALFVCGP